MNELWRIEAVNRPIAYCWPGGDLFLKPNHPICVPEQRALRLLAMAKGDARLLLRIGIRERVKWRVEDGQPVLSGYVEHVDASDDCWVLVNDGQSHTWVHMDRIVPTSSIPEPSCESGLGCESPPRSHRRRKGKNSMRQEKGGTS